MWNVYSFAANNPAILESIIEIVDLAIKDHPDIDSMTFKLFLVQIRVTR